MVWPFSSSESSSPAPPLVKSSDGGVIAPMRSSRETCYFARDGFFGCLDKHDILDAVKDDKGARQNCGKELAEFEASCSKAWVKYFKEKRVMEWKRDQTIEKIKAEDAAKQAELKGSKS